MFDLFPCIALSLSCVLLGTSHVWRPYEAPKEVWIVLSGMLIALWWGIHGSSQLPLPAWTVWLVAALLTLWGLRSLVTKLPQRALWDTVQYVCGLVIALACPFEWTVVAIVIASLLNCAYAIAQNVFKWEPMKGTTNAHKLYAIGFIGNENMLGTWLVPVICLTLWLVAVHWLWALALGPQLFVLVRTHCKAAMIGVVGGFFWLMFALGHPELVTLVVGLVWLAYMLVAKHYIRHGSNTFQERMNYWKIAWTQFKKAPVFGVGFSEFQNRVCFLQQELNDKSNGKFLLRDNYYDPWPRRCHNDLLQHLVDHGIVGTVLIVAYVLGALYYGINGGGWFAVCTTTAFAGLLMCGMGLHTFYLPPTNLMFWFLTISLYKTAPPTEVVLHGTTFLYVAVPVCLLILVLATRLILFELWFQKFLKTGDPKTRDRLLKWFPTSAVLHDYASLFCAKQVDAVGIVKHAALAIAHYDGINRLWEAYTNLGSGLMMLGAMQPAKLCYDRALKLWPSFERGQGALNQLTDIMKIMQSGKGVVMHYEQGGSNGKATDKGPAQGQQDSGPIHTSPEPVQQG